ncbi:MAG: exodeoxyribonuclease VII small subunit [Tissierellales bacterium]|nr:exodeoxyribonuclease VII small subunit [Tissierellales bacterium]
MKNDEMTYEEAYDRLKTILNELENGGLKLSEVFDKFKEAMTLYEYCKNVLDDVEGEVKLILKDDGQFREVDFEEDLKADDYV